MGGTVAQAVAPTIYRLECPRGHGFESNPLSFPDPTPHLVSPSHSLSKPSLSYPIKGKKPPKNPIVLMNNILQYTSTERNCFQTEALDSLLGVSEYPSHERWHSSPQGPFCLTLNLMSTGRPTGSGWRWTWHCRVVAKWSGFPPVSTRSRSMHSLGSAVQKTQTHRAIMQSQLVVLHDSGNIKVMDSIHSVFTCVCVHSVFTCVCSQ